MSTQIFLGPHPPPHVEAWMKANYKPKAAWVPAVYTDQWVYSDGQTYSDMKLYQLTEQLANSFGGVSDESLLGKWFWWFSGQWEVGYPQPEKSTMFDTEEEASKCIYVDGEVKAYRKYTPGHWEDTDGNWINGSWGNWNDEAYPPIYWMTYDEAKAAHENDWYSDVDDVSKLFGWQTGSSSLNYQNAKDAQNLNANLLYLDPSIGELWRRTWTNTVPEPNA